MSNRLCSRKVAARAFVLAGMWMLLLGLPALAQDDRSASTPASKVRSSPFDPPTEDVFVADTGAGLDTGCTFNTDSNHPLRIEVVINQAVGQVDANGFLVNPAALVADGVVPATINLILPAFDVDVHGAPPPENDDVLFNGERQGSLNGDNDIWILNSFSVPISKIKFPAPSTSGAPAPVSNIVQINIDTLSSGRWCTSIDWVALVIPIKLKAAFKLEPTAGNKIRVRDEASSATIDTIFQQSFDASCKVNTDIGPYDEYPFSGPSKKFFGLFTGSAELHATLDQCPRNTRSTPKVKAEWKIGGTSLKGVATWTGKEGDINLDMPDKVGSYEVEITFTIDGKKHPAIKRKLFVTKGAPLAQVAPPRLGWYEKATTWAAGQSDDGPILASLLGGIYSFGGAHWRYLDTSACSWEKLVADTVTCGDANCYIFSDVLENMAATLGVSGLSAIRRTGAHSPLGFLTNAKPSLDPNFTGNAKSVGGTTYDRYRFTSHSLRLKGGTYYDATFKGTYSSPTAFITANENSGYRFPDPNGPFATTDEGWNIYRLPGSLPGTTYDGWGNRGYKSPPPRGTAAAGKGLVPQATPAKANIRFTGNVTFNLVDGDLDGIAEALEAEVEVQLSANGEYVVMGTLAKGGVPIANQASWESSMPVEATLDEISGTYHVALKLSGEQIDRSGLDGPYELVLQGIGATGSTSATLATPAYAHSLFGESPARLAGASEAAVDSNGDGKLDYIEVTVDLGVRLAGEFRLQGALSKDGGTVADSGMSQTLAAGARQVSLRFDGRRIRRSGLDGPYEGSINLIDAENHTIDGIRFTTRPYSSASFAGLIVPQGPSGDQGIDSNGNGLFDVLRISFGADVEQAGSYRLTGVLRGAGSSPAVYTESLVTLPAGSANVQLEFSGPVINALELNGPYTVEVLVREPATLEELDAVRLPQSTASYQSTQFDPFGASNSAIVLTGASTDSGADTNANGLFDELRVDVGVSLARADFYRWSARLVDRNGMELGFYSSQASLSAGVTNLHFVFNGAAIGNNAEDGPYFVKGLLIFGSGGANLVSVDVAQTQPYAVAAFEGVPADVLAPEIITEGGLSDIGPANRKYNVVTVAGFVSGVTDNRDHNLSLDDVVITRVTSDEPDDAPGSDDGSTVNDIVIAPDCRSVELRSERASSGNGRVYTIHVAVVDAAGNVGAASHTAIVPLAILGGSGAVDSGPAYTVEGCTP